ncbi:invasion protein [Bradyrhizobium macuxiense]|uniref:Invasion protein n=1 Tax=Bradyrhizobium macuxiense TaxID=1755647 RepID=A0A125Q747_9BRAD|nr:invasion associated locus B family protein [Bradyrhizobium macuxiense]KWV49911.1 invasion protein [Bradyrhizobium macuxiense]
MVKANAAEKRLRAIVALVFIASSGSADAARTADTSNMQQTGGGAPIGARSQPPTADGTVRAFQLPKGASAISETYGDWIVKCVVDNGARLCTLSQSQVSKETNLQVFAIELLSRDGKTEGNMLMPFGLKLEAGAVLKLDNRDLEQVRFSTCTAQGCLLPLFFPTAVTDTLGRSKVLTVAAQNLNTGQAVVFNIPLNGFAAALERTIQLGS